MVHAEAERLGRPAHVFAETDMNDAPRYLDPPERGGYALDGQWNDDFHHTALVALTGHNEAYYTDYNGSAQELLSSAKYGCSRHAFAAKRRSPSAPGTESGPAPSTMRDQSASNRCR